MIKTFITSIKGRLSKHTQKNWTNMKCIHEKYIKIILKYKNTAEQVGKCLTILNRKFQHENYVNSI
jgi:hypothetical protein